MPQLRPFLLLLAALLLPTASAGAAENPFGHTLPFKSATVAYQITGNETGTETLHIADYGRKRARLRDSTAKFMFVTTRNHTLELIDPEWQITIDLDKKSGTKTINPVKLLNEEYNKLSAAEQKIVRRNLEKMGANAATGATVQYKAAKHLGHPCDVVTAAGVKSLVLSGTDVAAKVEIKTTGMQSRTVATKIDTKAAVAASKFAVPAGIKVNRDPAQDEAARRSAKATIAFLKDPEADKKVAAGVAEAERAQKESGQAAGEQKQDAAAEAMQKGLESLKGLLK